jgi:hypothetical protein
VAAALTAGIDPAGSRAAPILDDLVERYAETFQTTDTPKYRNALASSAGDRQRSANGALRQLAPRHQRLADPALPVPDLRLVHLRAAFAREQLITGRLDQQGCAVRRQPYENASP